MGLSPPLDDLVSQLPDPLEAGGVEHGADALGKCLLMLPADLPEGVASDVHLATLPGYALEVPLDGVDQAAVIVAGDQPHAAQSAVLEAPESPSYVASLSVSATSTASNSRKPSSRTPFTISTP